MLKTFSPLRLAFCAVCVLSLLGVQAYGQERDNDKDQTTVQPNGVVQDWSRRHLVYMRFGEINSLIKVQQDPRAILSWQAAAREDWHRYRGGLPHFHNEQGGPQRDWSISLGSGTTGPSMYPAKYTFDVNATASCANDFVVFPVNVAGGSTQPDIVAFNNLYSGTTPSNGICNRVPIGGVDTGVAATTFWSYNITAAGGMVPTSPALSVDGKKVAFVESSSGTTAHFHVLAWKSGDGVVTDLQSVLSPVTISSFATTDQAAGSGTVTDLALTPASGTASDTLSSPFVDFGQDRAYVGNDSGTLFRVINVFCQNSCTAGVSPAPSLDLTWGTGGALATGCTGKLSGPVVDSRTNNVFVGCSDGKLYGFTSAGVAITGSPLTVGDGTATGGIVDPPLVDPVNGLLYVVSGSSAGGTSVLVQAGTSSFTSPTPVTATYGKGGSFNLHAPSVNAEYFSSPNYWRWEIDDWALSTTGTNIEIYGTTFATGHVMASGAPTYHYQVGGSTPVEFSPTTEFLNGSSDLFIVSGITNAVPNFVEYNLNNYTNLFPTGFPPSGVAGATQSETGGTTGIIVDNVSASAQASSMYFGGLGSHSAVKLTDSGLN